MSENNKSKPLPGYAGHVPASENEVMPNKTALNLRMPLDERITPLQATRRAQSVPVAGGDDSPQRRIRSYFLPKRHVGFTTYTAQTQDYVRSMADVPERAGEPIAESNKVALPPFVAQTEKQVTCHTATGQVHNFYSTVRKIERSDDDARRNVFVAPTRSGAAHNLRTVDIARKRENDPALAPPKEEYVRVVKRTPNGLYSSPASETVKLTALPPHTSHEIEYSSPVERMDNLLATASVEQLKSNNKLMTLTSTTKDLFDGTAKARSDVIVGYMGHVPANKTNVARIKAEMEDLRTFSKCCVRLAAPRSGFPGYTGFSKPGHEVDLSNDTRAEINRANLECTMDIGQERTLNTRDGTGRKNAVRGFFSVGVGQQDSIIADQFCSRYRPLEGVMKMGPPSTRNWTTEKELRRRIAM